MSPAAGWLCKIQGITPGKVDGVGNSNIAKISDI